jgi:hypothetical protein
LLEFVPCSLELTLGALMSYSIKPCVLDQNIEAMEKRPSGRAATGVSWSGVSDNSLLSGYGAVQQAYAGK